MVQLLLFTTVLAGILFGINAVADEWVHPLAFWLLAFFLVVTAAGRWFLGRLMRQNPDNLMSAYLGVTAFRLLISIALIAVFLVKRGPQTYTFVINFFILYLLYVGFEIRDVLGNLRRNSPKTE